MSASYSSLFRGSMEGLTKVDRWSIEGPSRAYIEGLYWGPIDGPWILYRCLFRSRWKMYFCRLKPSLKKEIYFYIYRTLTFMLNGQLHIFTMFSAAPIVELRPSADSTRLKPFWAWNRVFNKLGSEMKTKMQYA